MILRKLAAPLSAAILLILGSCIKNDIPYPRIQANFTSLAAAGQIKDAAIDSASRVVTVTLPEEANIYEVKIDSFSLSPNTVVADDALKPGQVIDLSATYYVTLTMYQDYLWRIKGVQDIERYFTLQGQIGASTIDVPGRRIVATVSKNTSLKSIMVESIKLGATTSTMSPDISGKLVDFSHPVVINVENHDHFERWTIYVNQAEASVETVRADAWTRVAWVYGQAQAGRANTVQYRIKGDTEWLTVPDSWLTHDNGSFHARLVGLSPLTTYEARAVSGEDFGQALEFTTGQELQLPNSDFSQWWLDGKVWCPWAEGGTPFWDTGNKGASTLGQSNTTPTEDTVDGEGLAANCATKFVGIGMLGKLAAGNIYAGTFKKVDGTNGILDMGRPFTQRPTKLRGYWKYKTAPISSVADGYDDWKGRPDTCIVWIALIDGPTPFEVRTNPKNQHLFDPSLPQVIAYGAIQTGTNISAYEPFEIELDYVATDRVPTFLLLTASASKYGDYFMGGNGAVLQVDDFELVYDYE